MLLLKIVFSIANYFHIPYRYNTTTVIYWSLNEKLRTRPDLTICERVCELLLAYTNSVSDLPSMALLSSPD